MNCLARLVYRVPVRDTESSKVTMRLSCLALAHAVLAVIGAPTAPPLWRLHTRLDAGEVEDEVSSPASLLRVSEHVRGQKNRSSRSSGGPGTLDAEGVKGRPPLTAHQRRHGSHSLTCPYTRSPIVPCAGVGWGQPRQTKRPPSPSPSLRCRSSSKRSNEGIGHHPPPTVDLTPTAPTHHRRFPANARSCYHRPSFATVYCCLHHSMLHGYQRP